MKLAIVRLCRLWQPPDLAYSAPSARDRGVGHGGVPTLVFQGPRKVKNSEAAENAGYYGRSI